MKSKEKIGKLAFASQCHNSKQLTGLTSDKYAILLDDGKTVVYISDKSKEAETRLKYKMLGLRSKI
jgi:hypothetical protein